jgi:hypothetical protein
MFKQRVPIEDFERVERKDEFDKDKDPQDHPAHCSDGFRFPNRLSGLNLLILH